MDDRKDSILFAKINAISTINNEIIGRIEEKKAQNCDVIIGYSYSVEIGRCALAQLKDNIQLSENKNFEKASVIIDRWCTSERLKQVQDVFNDKIDFTCSCFADLIRLNREMPTVAHKYAFFDCTNSALGVIKNFLENIESLQIFLGEIETALQDAESSLPELEEGKEKLKQQAIEYNTQLEKIREKEKTNNERRVKEIERFKEFRIAAEEEACLKKEYPLLSYEEAKKKKALVTLSPTFSAHESKLREWTQSKGFDLLYKGSRDGFGAANFHGKCNNRGATLTLIKSTEGYLFGGYTPITWTSRENYAWDPQTFIFTLINPHGREPTKFTNTGPSHSNTYSIYDNSGYAPTFGGGHDIRVSNNCNSVTCSINFPHSFQDSTGLGRNIFVNSNSFLISEIEVYLVL